MRSDTELLKDALKIIKERLADTQWKHEAMEEIRARLAEPEPAPYIYMWEGETIDTHRKLRIMLDEPRFPPGVVSEKPIFPLYRHPPRPVLLSNEEIRNVFLSNGFTIKHGNNNLKPYVFNAARALEKAVLEKNQ